MWESKHDMDSTEMRTMMSSNDLEITLMINKGKYFQKLYKIQNNPYFDLNELMILVWFLAQLVDKISENEIYSSTQ